jgi:Tfp pilus assembly protein PilF/ADP-heptose:LPS heptosyltransferase
MSASTPEARAFALLQAGNLGEAEAALRAILAGKPDAVDALHLLGCVLFQAGRQEEGLDLVERTLARDPSNPGFVANAASMRRVRANALNDAGVALLREGRSDDALRAFDAAHVLDPRNADALNNRGIALQRRGELDAAAASYARAIEARPGFAQASLNWGNALKDAGDLEGARERYRNAAAQMPGLAQAWVNLGSIALALADRDEARASYRRALELDAASADARFGLAQVALRSHDFAAGWEGYERRFDTAPPQAQRRTMAARPLERADLGSGMRVAVWKEQGVGDQVLFATLLPELAAAGVRPVVEVDARLAPAMRRSLPSIAFTTPDDAERDFAACERQVALGSLPRLFRPDAASFARQPRALLRADPERVVRIREALGAGPWIAISWRSLQSGDRRALGDRKSLALEDFAAIAGESGARLLDLQYGDVAEERARFESSHPGLLGRVEGLDTYNDFEGILAALEACERVVTASNVTAHLAGALGKPTRVIFRGDWPPFHYWTPGANGRSLWYPSVAPGKK